MSSLGCAPVNSAAYFAMSYSVNGFDDWFLGSRDETALALARTGFSNDTSIFTSSEIDGSYFWVLPAIVCDTYGNLCGGTRFTVDGLSLTARPRLKAGSYQENGMSVRPIRSFVINGPTVP
jgi:hypothetical protein